MRNKNVVFSRAPEAVRKVLQDHCIEGKKQKKKMLQLQPDKFQLDTVRKIAATIPRELLVLASRLLVGKVDEFIELTGRMPQSMTLMHGCGDYSYFLYETTEGSVVALWKNDKFLAQGTTQDLFVYAGKYEKRALSTVIMGARIHYVGGSADKFDRATVQEIMSDYRTVRRVSGGLDRLSKLDQLPGFDDDNTAIKFFQADPYEGNEVVHIGSGHELSCSQYGIGNNITIVDPLITNPSSRAHNKTYEQYVATYGMPKVLVSDVAYGDTSGLTTSKAYVKFVEDYYNQDFEHGLFKLDLSEHYNIRCVLFSKPRPHNLEVVVELDREGEPWSVLKQRVLEGVMAANEARNERVIKCQLSDRIRRPSVNPYDIESLAARYINLASPGRIKHRKEDDRLSAHLTPTRHVKAVMRRKSYRDACFDPNFAMEGPHAIIPIKDKGPLHFKDPNVGDGHFSLRTMIQSTFRSGGNVVYTESGWTAI